MLNNMKFELLFNTQKPNIYNDLLTNIPYKMFIKKYGKISLKKYVKLQHDAFYKNKHINNETFTTQNAEDKLKSLTDAVKSCSNALDAIIDVTEQNMQTLKKYTDEKNKYESNLNDYNNKLNSVTIYCNNESVKRKILPNNRDGECGSVGKYGTMKKVSEVLTTPGCTPDFACTHRDVCAYISQSNAKQTCITQRMTMINPTAPLDPILLPVPTITCQICPNIMSMNTNNSGEINIDGVITQTNTCITTKENEIDDLKKSINSTDNTDDNLFDTEKTKIIVIITTLLIISLILMK